MSEQQARVSGSPTSPRLSDMRTLKNEAGDWVAVRTPGAEGGYRLAKVIEASSDSVVVRLRFEDGERELRFSDPLPRVRWTGRGRWTV